MGTSPSAVGLAAIDGLADGWDSEVQIEVTPELESNLRQLVSATAPATQGKLVHLARLWGSTELIVRRPSGWTPRAS
jgi:hypothetical protein